MLRFCKSYEAAAALALRTWSRNCCWRRVRLRTVAGGPCRAKPTSGPEPAHGPPSRLVPLLPLALMSHSETWSAPLSSSFLGYFSVRRQEVLCSRRHVHVGVLWADTYAGCDAERRRAPDHAGGGGRTRSGIATPLRRSRGKCVRCGGGNVRLKDAGQHEAAIRQPSISKFHISHKSIKYYIKNNTFSKIFLGVENRQIFFLFQQKKTNFHDQVDCK